MEHAITHSIKTANCLKVTSTLLIILAFITSPLVAQKKEPEKVYLKEFQKARDNESDCIYKGNQAACTKMFAAYDRAATAPDATSGVRHDLFKYRMEAKTKKMEQDMGAYYSADYVTQLQGAYDELMSHFEGGKHAHAIIEHLRLQILFADQLFFQERFYEGDRVLRLSRGTAEKYWNAREQIAGDPKLKELFDQLLIDMPREEQELGKKLVDRASYEVPAGKEESHERAITSWEFVELWVYRQAEMGVRHPMDQRWELMIAEANFKLGFLHGNKEYSLYDEELSKRHFEKTAAMSCSLLDPEKAEELGTTPAETHERPVAQALCDRSIFILSGEMEKMVDEAVEQMINQAMKNLNDSPAKNK